MLRQTAILSALAALATAQDKVTFDEHVLPIFQQSCLNCHNPDKTKGGLDLSSFAGAMKGSSGGKIVEPGDPGSSLITVVQQTAEPKMPPEGEKLSNDHIQILKRWIEGGLLENPASTARKATKPKFEISPRTDPAAKPEGPPPMPAHLLLEPPVITHQASAVHALVASPWAPLLAVTSQRQVLLHHTESLELIGILPFPEGDPISLAFTPDGRYLIVGGGVPGKSGVTVTFDVTTGHRLLSAAKEFDSVLAADIRPGFDIVATGGPSKLLKLWNTASGELMKSIKKHSDWITALDLSPDGVLLASGDRNGGVWVWESDTGNEFHNLRAHQAGISAAVFRGDSNLLATSSEDGTVRFWEMNGGSEVKKIDAHPGGVTAFSFARDGSSLSVGRDLKGKLWKPDFALLRELAQPLPALPTAAALDAESRRAFVGDSRGMVMVYHTADGKPLGQIESNPPPIASRIETLRTRIAELEKQTTPAATQPGAKDDDKTNPPVAASATPEPTPIQSLNASLKRWTAAAINTRLLEARKLSGTAAATVEDSQLAFTEAAGKIALQAEILNRKRSDRQQLASRSDSADCPPEIHAEISATLTAIDLVIARELESLRAAEIGFDQIARAIDPAVRVALDQNAESETLQKAYQKALE